MTLVVVDADVLGRQRTGDETYVRNLLRELAPLTEELGIRLAAVTRHPELVPAGVEAVALGATSQELRMAWSLPRALGRLRADLCHTQYALPMRSSCPCVVTIHDLSFERRPELMGWKDRLVFRRVVPRAARRAARVLTVSERTKRDLVDLYAVAPERVVVTPNGVDPTFTPGRVMVTPNGVDPALAPEPVVVTPNGVDPAVAAGPGAGDYVLAVGAIEQRKNQLAALDAARENDLPLVVAGPARDTALAAELRRRGARLEGHVDTARLADLYRGAACLVQASRFEGFGLPVLEAMGCGTPVVAVREPALEEVAGEAAVIVAEDELAVGIKRAIAERDRLVAAGLERARTFSWRASAEKTLAVYREVLGG